MANKYLKLFNQHSEYTDFTQTADFVRPNVSHCIVENHVHYNPSLVVITTFMDNFDPAYGPGPFTVFNGQEHNPQTKANQFFEKVVVDGVVYEGDDLDVITFEVEMGHSETPHIITYYVKTTTFGAGLIPWQQYDTVTVGEGVTALGGGVGYYAMINTFHLPDSLITIEDYAFSCSDIRTMNIPKNVTSIGHYGLDFWNMNLESLYIYPDVPPTIYSDSITRVPANAVFYVKPELVETYKTANIWSNFASRIQAMP
jgi:hypothetical protein